MIVKQFRLSQPEKDRLIRVKARTGISNWNGLCRWALCWSLGDPSIPSGTNVPSDSNVEMTWQTFGGDNHEIYDSLIRQRCMEDGLDTDPETLVRYFRSHLSRGINHLSSKGLIRSSQDLIALINAAEMR